MSQTPGLEPEPVVGAVRRDHLKPRRGGFPMYVVLTAVVMAAGGFAHGMWTGRWSDVSDKTIETTLNRVPLRFANWEGRDLPTPDHPPELNVLYREYRNRITGRSVNLLLLGADAGTLASNTLDRVFGSRGYRSMNNPTPLDIRANHSNQAARVVHAFLGVNYYEPASLNTDQLVTASGWTDRGIWESPANPLERFDQAPHVYRVFVTQTWDLAEKKQPDDVRDFLTMAVPHLTMAVVGRPEMQP